MSQSKNEAALEVERIRKMYTDRDTDPVVIQTWAPFAADEVDYRIQQYWCLAALMRSVGKSSLKGLDILDVGCGQGRHLRACLDLGAEPKNLFGVDLHPKAIERARHLSPQLDFRVANGTDLDFADEQFDLVTQFVVFSSIFNQQLRQRLASEMVRVLKLGGYVFWWDLTNTVHRDQPESLRPGELFPGLNCHELPAGLRSQPSYSMLLPRLLRPFRALVDKFAYPTTHIAALIGPKNI